MNKITENNSGRVDVFKAYELFPHIPKGALERPRGPVSILIGQDNASLLPYGGGGHDRCDNLRAKRVILGKGYVLGGSHPSIVTQSLKMAREVEELKTSLLIQVMKQQVKHISAIKHEEHVMEGDDNEYDSDKKDIS